MSGNKTVPTDQSVDSFLEGIKDEQKRADSFELKHLMQKITGEKAVMWGSSIIGFGKYHYKYNSGREGDMLMVGFSPRAQNLSIYILPGFNRFEELMRQLGKYKTGKSCLYIKKLDDVNKEVLKELISTSYSYVKQKY